MTQTTANLSLAMRRALRLLCDAFPAAVSADSHKLREVRRSTLAALRSRELAIQSPGPAGQWMATDSGLAVCADEKAER